MDRIGQGADHFAARRCRSAELSPEPVAARNAEPLDQWR